MQTQSTRVMILAVGALALMVLAWAAPAQAATFTWNHSTIGGEWTDQARWLDGLSGYPTAAGDFADFNLSTAGNPPSDRLHIDVTVGSAVTVGRIDCGGNYPQGPPYRGSVKLLTGAGPITLNNNGSGAVIDWDGDFNLTYLCDVPLILADNLLFQSSTQIDPDLNSTISEAGVPRKLTLAVRGRDGLTDGLDIGGTARNTYSGGTDFRPVSAVTLRLLKDGSLGTGDVILNVASQNAILRITDGGDKEDRIDDAASVYMKSVGNHIKIRLDEGVNESVGELYFDGIEQAHGTWGSSASAADNKNDTFFDSGYSGILTVGVTLPTGLLLHVR